MTRRRSCARCVPKVLPTTWRCHLCSRTARCMPQRGRQNTRAVFLTSISLRCSRSFHPFARVAEIRALQRTAGNLLDTYVGNNAGARILAGQIRRGHADKIHAAIWLSDMRGFTAMSDRLPPEMVVDVLNRYFDCQVPAVLDHGGEVLKFMGDGLLAIFPIASDDSNVDEVCSRTLDAARATRANVDAFERRERRRTWAAVALRTSATRGRSSVRQYRRRRPARLYLHRAGRESRGPAGKGCLDAGPHGGRIGTIRGAVPIRDGGARRIFGGRVCGGADRLRIAR